MTIFVLDPYAVLELDAVVKKDSCRFQVSDLLSNMVRSDSLTFPDDVLQECKEFDSTDWAVIWAGSIAGSRH